LWLALYAAFGPGKSKYEAEKEWREIIELDEYCRSIGDRILQNWTPPASMQVGLESILDVYQEPNGEIVEVHVRCPKGDDVLKTSIETAIQRSSPLPKSPISSRSKRHLEIFFNPSVEN
jgi:hypothetical protein